MTERGERRMAMDEKNLHNKMTDKDLIDDLRKTGKDPQYILDT